MTFGNFHLPLNHMWLLLNIEHSVMCAVNTTFEAIKCETEKINDITARMENVPANDIETWSENNRSTLEQSYVYAF